MNSKREWKSLVALRSSTGHWVLELPDDVRDRLFKALQAYACEHFDADLGVLRTEHFYEFVVGLIGSAAYNQGVHDAEAWLQGKLLDLEGDLFEEIRDKT